jgi:uncharacterized protein YjbI with pentapeptide repeats
MIRPSLAVAALSPVATGTAFCRLGGVLWATVVVEATFQLVHGDTARLIAPEELVSADRPGPRGTLERARETAPHLPNAGVLLSGHAYAPGGRAVPSTSVRLGISRDRPIIDRTLHVFGERSAAAPQSIAPFQKMPLVYERAFGGAGIHENPAGIGGSGSTSLPNIVDPRDPRRPAGFGPIASDWAPRRTSRGSLEPAAQAGPILEVTPSFDWRFFQAAPADQQTDHLRGDEWIVLDGMSPSLPRVQSRLPQVMALARRQVVSAGGTVAEQPIDLRADMLVIDADRSTASLIWRGRFPVASLEALSTMRVLVGLERPGEPVQWPAGGAAAAAPSAAVAGKGKDISTETQEVNVAAILGAKVPFSPARASPAAAKLPTETAEVSLSAILGAKVPFSPARGEPPAESLPAPTERKATPMSTGTTDIDVTALLKGATLHRGAAAAPPAPVPIAPAAPVAPRPAIAEPPAPEPPVPVAAPPIPLAAPPPPPEQPARRAAPAATTLARKRAEAILESGRAFDGEDFAGANLSGLDLSGRSLVRCNLRGARLRGTKLDGAALTSAILDEADLRGAVLEGADLRDASLVRADLERARLGRCDGAGAVLREASLLGADLRRARFPGASFESAVLRDAQADGADLTGARLDHADLSASSFREARLASAVLAFASLDRADFQRASLQNANLHGASRRMTRLAGADLTGLVEEPPGSGHGAGD